MEVCNVLLIPDVHCFEKQPYIHLYINSMVTSMGASSSNVWRHDVWTTCVSTCTLTNHVHCFEIHPQMFVRSPGRGAIPFDSDSVIGRQHFIVHTESCIRQELDDVSVIKKEKY